MDTVFGAMRGQGFAVTGAPAENTRTVNDARARSGGAFVAVHTSVHSELVWPFGRSDLSPAAAPGRITGRWVDWRGGLVVLAAYFDHSVGWGGANHEIATQLAVIVAALSDPWIMKNGRQVVEHFACVPRLPARVTKTGDSSCERAGRHRPNELTNLLRSVLSKVRVEARLPEIA